MTDSAIDHIRQRVQVINGLSDAGHEFHALLQDIDVDDVLDLRSGPDGCVDELVEKCSKLLADGVPMGLFVHEMWEGVRRNSVENQILPAEKQHNLFRAVVKSFSERPWTVCEWLVESADNETRHLATVVGVSDDYQR